LEGARLGAWLVGLAVGIIVGAELGLEGINVGSFVGAKLGLVGNSVARDDGDTVGERLGARVLGAIDERVGNNVVGINVGLVLIVGVNEGALGARVVGRDDDGAVVGRDDDGAVVGRDDDGAVVDDKIVGRALVGASEGLLGRDDDGFNDETATLGFAVDAATLGLAVVGSDDGDAVGKRVGLVVGMRVGAMLGVVGPTVGSYTK